MKLQSFSYGITSSAFIHERILIKLSEYAKIMKKNNFENYISSI